MPVQFLIDWIKRALDRRLLVVVVPQKEEIMDWVRQAIGQIKEPVDWLTLAASDNLPPSFQAHLAAVMNKLALDGRLGSFDPPEQNEGLEDWIVSLINWAADWRVDRVLVIDNYTIIVAAEIHRAIALLIDFLPPHLHVILITQGEPPLPLGHWRVRRQVAEINLM